MNDFGCSVSYFSQTCLDLHLGSRVGLCKDSPATKALMSKPGDLVNKDLDSRWMESSFYKYDRSSILPPHTNTYPHLWTRRTRAAHPFTRTLH
jgi:hypothetical protein